MSAFWVLMILSHASIAPIILNTEEWHWCSINCLCGSWLILLRVILQSIVVNLIQCLRLNLIKHGLIPFPSCFFQKNITLKDILADVYFLGNEDSHAMLMLPWYIVVKTETGYWYALSSLNSPLSEICLSII